MDCIGLCENFTIEDCTELKQDCLDWTGIVTDFGPTIGLAIEKIHLQSSKSKSPDNINVVPLRDFSGLVYTYFPKSYYIGVHLIDMN